jgi:hypothetical protein
LTFKSNKLAIFLKANMTAKEKLLSVFKKLYEEGGNACCHQPMAISQKWQLNTCDLAVALDALTTDGLLLPRVERNSSYCLSDAGLIAIGKLHP